MFYNILQLISAFLASLFFAVLCNTPKKVLILCGLSGMMGWGVFLISKNLSLSYILSSFFAACMVNILSEIFARVFKNPVPLFLIPGIIPLVPGAGMYNTMIALIKNNIDEAIKTGFETLLVAGSIAIALMLVSSINRIFKVFN